jgi:hypothetical protein
MSDISAPVAATSRIGAKINCKNGTANTPARAPIANDRASRATPAQSATPRTKAGGQMTAKPPAKVSTLRPPRSRAKTGQACPIMAAATAAYTRATPPGARPPRITCPRIAWAKTPCTRTPCASIRPSRPAAVPFSVSPASTGRAPAHPSWSFMFQKPGFWSPTWRGSTPCARPASTATGIEPKR